MAITAAAGGLACLLVIVSLLPLHAKMALGVDRSRDLHVASHLFAFFLLASLFRLWLWRRHAMAAALLALLVGAAIEILEHALYRSPMEWKDVLLDGAAACAGALVTDWLMSLDRHPRSNFRE